MALAYEKPHALRPYQKTLLQWANAALFAQLSDEKVPKV
jgi:hypothetical protein